MMDLKDFFARLLNLVNPWTVKTVVFEEHADVVEVYVECAGAMQLPCPSCDLLCPVTGFSAAMRWRHSDTCLKKTFVHAGLPVVDCPRHGKRNCRVPWASPAARNAGTLMTEEFENWLAALARSLQDTKKAAGIAGVEPWVVRRLLGSRGGEARQHSAAGGAPREGEDRAPQRAQLSLFEQSDMQFLNRGVRAFGDLELEEALKLFEKYRVHYPKGFDVTSRLRITEFLLEGFRGLPAELCERPGYLCRLWDSFEEYSKTQGAECAVFAARAKKAYFVKVLQELERSGGDQSAGPGLDRPAGYVLLQAGRFDEAIGSLQEHILQAPDNAALYGWLGDAYLLRGDLTAARQCYREACFIDPSALDWRHLEDAELKQLKEDILFEYGADPELAVEWLPSHARIEGLFERKVVRIHDGLKEIVETYLAVEKEWRRKKSPRLAARLFARGMVLCENAESLKHIKKVEPIEVRRMMKQANPDLFEEFLTGLKETP